MPFENARRFWISICPANTERDPEVMLVHIRGWLVVEAVVGGDVEIQIIDNLDSKDEIGFNPPPFEFEQSRVDV